MIIYEVLVKFNVKLINNAAKKSVSATIYLLVYQTQSKQSYCRSDATVKLRLLLQFFVCPYVCPWLPSLYCAIKKKKVSGGFFWFVCFCLVIVFLI